MFRRPREPSTTQDPDMGEESGTNLNVNTSPQMDENPELQDTDVWLDHDVPIEDDDDDGGDDNDDDSDNERDQTQTIAAVLAFLKDNKNKEKKAKGKGKSQTQKQSHANLGSAHPKTVAIPSPGTSANAMRISSSSSQISKCIEGQDNIKKRCTAFNGSPPKLNINEDLSQYQVWNIHWKAFLVSSGINDKDNDVQILQLELLSVKH